MSICSRLPHKKKLNYETAMSEGIKSVKDTNIRNNYKSVSLSSYFHANNVYPVYA